MSKKKSKKTPQRLKKLQQEDPTWDDAPNDNDNDNDNDASSDDEPKSYGIDVRQWTDTGDFLYNLPRRSSRRYHKASQGK